MTQILQPGNIPAWSSDDPASEIADIFANETWPLLWPGLLRSYATAGARDAELAGLGSTDRVFAFVEDSRTFWRWTGTGWALAAPWVQTDAPLTLNGNATDPRGATVVFPFAFPAPPRVVLQVKTSASTASIVTQAVTQNVTATGFSIVVLRNSTTSVVVDWTATLVP